jgi:hypothetical protein
MASRGDKVEQSMNTIITESWIALDTRFLRQNIVVLSLKITNDLTEAIQNIRY